MYKTTFFSSLTVLMLALAPARAGSVAHTYGSENVRALHRASASIQHAYGEDQAVASFGIETTIQGRQAPAIDIQVAARSRYDGVPSDRVERTVRLGGYDLVPYGAVYNEQPEGRVVLDTQVDTYRIFRLRDLRVSVCGVELSYSMAILSTATGRLVGGAGLLPLDGPGGFGVRREGDPARRAEIWGRIDGRVTASVQLSTSAWRWNFAARENLEPFRGHFLVHLKSGPAERRGAFGLLRAATTPLDLAFSRTFYSPRLGRNQTVTTTLVNGTIPDRTSILCYDHPERLDPFLLGNWANLSSQPLAGAGDDPDGGVAPATGMATSQDADTLYLAQAHGPFAAGAAIALDRIEGGTIEAEVDQFATDYLGTVVYRFYLHGTIYIDGYGPFGDPDPDGIGHGSVE